MKNYSVQSPKSQMLSLRGVVAPLRLPNSQCCFPERKLKNSMLMLSPMYAILFYFATVCCDAFEHFSISHIMCKCRSKFRNIGTPILSYVQMMLDTTADLDEGFQGNRFSFFVIEWTSNTIRYCGKKKKKKTLSGESLRSGIQFFPRLRGPAILAGLFGVLIAIIPGVGPYLANCLLLKLYEPIRKTFISNNLFAV